MKLRVNRTRYAQLFVVLLCAAGLKYFYSTASVNQLRWILAPTTLLVELISGARFQFESYAGYMSSDHTFLIAASCAGVNFLLTAFVMLALRKLWKSRDGQTSWSFIPIAIVLAYGATLIANAVRISTALRLRQLSSEMNWLTPEQLHRVEGILIYFGFLLILFLVSERMDDGMPGGEVALESQSTIWRLRKGVRFPLFIYYATTLGMPFLNGAYRQGADFWQHSLFVFLTPLVFVLPVIAVHLLRKQNAIRFWRK